MEDSLVRRVGSKSPKVRKRFESESRLMVKPTNSDFAQAKPGIVFPTASVSVLKSCLGRENF